MSAFAVVRRDFDVEGRGKKCENWLSVAVRLSVCLGWFPLSSLAVTGRVTDGDVSYSVKPALLPYTLENRRVVECEADEEGGAGGGRNAAELDMGEIGELYWLFLPSAAVSVGLKELDIVGTASKPTRTIVW